MFQWQKLHIFNELITHGVEIELFNPLKFDSFDEANDKVIERIKKGDVDLFMTSSTEKDLYIETLSIIKQHGTPTLLICFDNLTVPFTHKKISPHFDLVWLTSIETKYLFDKWGVNSIFMPYAANPNIGNPRFHKDNESVLFIGTPYGSRCKIINTLLDAEIPVSLHTRSTSVKSNFIPKNDNGEMCKEIFRMLSFPIGRKLAYASAKNKLLKQSPLHSNSKYLTLKDPVPFSTMMDLYNEHALSLTSVSNKHTGVLKKPVLIVNLRSFEIPAAGGLIFSLFNPELNGYFEDGKEAVYYQNDEDMIDKAKFHLSSHNRYIRETLKRNARARAIAEHTWYCRFKKVFDTLGLK